MSRLVRSLRPLLALLAVALAAPLAAQAVRIDFGTDPDFDPRPGPFTSSQSSLVTFLALDGGSLRLRAPFQNEPQNKILFAFGAGVPSFGGVRLSFQTYVERVSLLWGNDDPRRLGPNAAGVFRLYDGTTLLETLRLGVNANTLVDQEFSVTGRRFNRLEFVLDQDQPGTNTDLADAIARIEFTVAGPTAVVPEPGSVALLGGGLSALALLARLRRRRA